MATVQTTAEVPDEILKEYEVVGVRRITKGELYLDIYAVSEWRGRDMSECRYIVLRKKFVWPEWLKAAAIMMNNTGHWCACGVVPSIDELGWLRCGELGHLSPLLYAVDLPKLDPSQWRESLIVNPNREGEK